ncbi:hypothetical protein CEK26_009678 [Fusarium fujikuroi]|uniref:Uncharacterized protein n=1 Tax=Fusarium fujikuroi TaxID=5127 RepID=A0A5Q3FZQ3_FUSFU|nr:hypothetical protein CEK25_009700 [Fusarium fujikuroi]QGI96609.1 hypothetical protein CEK26_009678 [Fusarium fujikuroi]VTT65924.1 unnamed protein product [Fusarium fujikuroi]VZH88980.1 unnamed protein product [Fusarium fujikuroi]
MERKETKRDTERAKKLIHTIRPASHVLGINWAGPVPRHFFFCSLHVHRPLEKSKACRDRERESSICPLTTPVHHLQMRLTNETTPKVGCSVLFLRSLLIVPISSARICRMYVQYKFVVDSRGTIHCIQKKRNYCHHSSAVAESQVPNSVADLTGRERQRDSQSSPADGCCMLRPQIFASRCPKILDLRKSLLGLFFVSGKRDDAFMSVICCRPARIGSTVASSVALGMGMRHRGSKAHTPPEAIMKQYGVKLCEIRYLSPVIVEHSAD